MALLVPGSAGAATIDVNTTADNLTDDQLCSLREAIESANGNSDPNPGGGQDCVSGEADTDTISLAGGPTTYTLAIPGPGEDSNQTGDLDVDAVAGGPVVIDGGGATETIIDAGGLDRGVDLHGGTLTIRELTLTGGDPGNAFGGGIFARGTPTTTSDVTVENATLSGNVANSGGGIFLSPGNTTASLTLTNAEVSSNDITILTGQGGAGVRTGTGVTLTATDSTISDNHAGVGGFGGGIRAEGTTTLTNTEVSLNSIDSSQGGGGVAATGPLTIESGSTITGNQSTGDFTSAYGGGVKATATTAITDSTISGNSTGDGDATTQTGAPGGGVAFVPAAPATLTIDDSLFQGNSSETEGGGLYVNDQNATAEITDTTFVLNDASTEEPSQTVRGGAIYSDEQSTLSVSTSWFDQNEASSDSSMGVASGGGVVSRNATATIANSLFEQNTVTAGTQGYGGGIVSEGSTAATPMTVAGTTVAANVVNVPGATGRGGGLAQNSVGTMTVVNSTISGNTVTASTATGGGMEAQSPSSGTVALDLVNVTISGNTATTGPALHRTIGGYEITLKGAIIDQACAADAGGFTSAGHNIEAGDSCDLGMAGDLPNTPLTFDPTGLVDNGGPHAGVPPGSPIPTLGLPADSLAVDHIPAAACRDTSNMALTTDQRGFPRPSPSVGNCDAGAYELTQPEPPPPPPPPPPATPLPSNTFDFGKVKRKKKKGIAFLIAFVPGPGQVGLAGKGIKNRGLASAAATKSVFTSGGRVKLKVVPTKKGKGRKIRQRLRTKGKAKVKVRVTYLPNGGFANARVKKFKLIRK